MSQLDYGRLSKAELTVLMHQHTARHRQDLKNRAQDRGLERMTGGRRSVSPDDMLRSRRQRNLETRMLKRFSMTRRVR